MPSNDFINMYTTISNKLVFIGEQNCYIYSIVNCTESGYDSDFDNSQDHRIIISLNDEQLLVINKITSFDSIDFDKVSFTTDSSCFTELYIDSSDMHMEAYVIALVNFYYSETFTTGKFTFLSAITDIKGIDYITMNDRDAKDKFIMLNLLINELNNIYDLVKNNYSYMKCEDIKSSTSVRKEIFLKYVLDKYNFDNIKSELSCQYKNLLKKITIEINQSVRPDFLNEFSKLNEDYYSDDVYSSTVYKSSQSYYSHSTVSFVSASLSRQSVSQGLNFGTM